MEQVRAEDGSGRSAHGAPVVGGYRTILSGPDYHVKHPLQAHWTLYQKLGQVAGASSRGVSQESWEGNLRSSVTIGTVEDFWWYCAAVVFLTTGVQRVQQHAGCHIDTQQL